MNLSRVVLETRDFEVQHPRRNFAFQTYLLQQRSETESLRTLSGQTAPGFFRPPLVPVPLPATVHEPVPCPPAPPVLPSPSTRVIPRARSSRSSLAPAVRSRPLTRSLPQAAREAPSQQLSRRANPPC